MNFRAIILVLVIVVFAVSMGAVNFASLGSVDLEQAQTEGKTLDKSTYLQLAKPSERDPVQRFARVDADLYDRVLNRCIEEGQVCMHEMMAMNDRARAALPADQCTPANAPQTIAALERPAASLAPQAEAAQ